VKAQNGFACTPYEEKLPVYFWVIIGVAFFTCIALLVMIMRKNMVRARQSAQNQARLQEGIMSGREQQSAQTGTITSASSGERNRGRSTPRETGPGRLFSRSRNSKAQKPPPIQVINSSAVITATTQSGADVLPTQNNNEPSKDEEEEVKNQSIIEGRPADAIPGLNPSNQHSRKSSITLTNINISPNEEMKIPEERPLNNQETTRTYPTNGNSQP